MLCCMSYCFAVQKMNERHSIHNNMKTDLFIRCGLGLTCGKYSEIMYIAIYGMSSDVIHSDWGELRQLHLCDLGDGMMAPNIDNVKWRHYRIILPIAYTVANAISFFIPFINTSKSIVEIGDALMAMDSEIIRVLNLVMEKMLDDYNEDPDKFMIV